MNKDSLNSQYIHFSDIKKYLKTCKKAFFFSSLALAFCVAGFLLIKEPKYQTSATFKEAEVKTDSASSNLIRKIFSESSHTEVGTFAQMIMLSQTLIHETIKKMCLQAKISEPKLVDKFKTRIKHQFAIACNKALPEICVPTFEDLYYEGETKKTFLLEVIDKSKFKLKSTGGKKLLSFNSGEHVSYENVHFKLHIPEEFAQEFRVYKLEIFPLDETYNKIRRSLHINVKKDEQKLLDLSYSHRDRHLASNFLNTHMLNYKEYLVREHEKLSKEQLVFLSKRQQEIGQNLEESLNKYCNYIKSQFGDEGFINLAQQIAVLDERKKEHLDKLFKIDLALSQYEAKDKINSDGLPLDENQKELHKKVSQLKKRKKALSLYQLFHKKRDRKLSPLHTTIDPSYTQALQQHEERVDRELHLSKDHVLPIFDYLKPALSELRFRQKKLYMEKKSEDFFQKFDFGAKNLNDLRKVKNDATRLLYEIEKGNEVQIQKTALSAFFGSDTELDHDDTKRMLFKNFLVSLIDLASLKEKLQSETLCTCETKSDELIGLDLDSIDKLYFQTLEELDSIRFDKNKVSLAYEKIKLDDFEVSSLTSLSSNAIDEDMVLTLSKLHHSLRDEPNLTMKDKQRLKRKISQENTRLVRHLEHQADLLDIRETVLKQKIDIIKCAQLEQINQEIALFEQQLDLAIDEKVLALKQEKTYLSQKLKQISNLLKTMPEKWFMENKLQFGTDLNLSIMEGISHLVESKSIDHQLLHIESKPIDYALVPYSPINNHLWLLSSVGGLFGGLLTISFLLTRKIQKGLPLSLEGLKSRELQTFGSISDDCNTKDFSALSKEDLTAIRYISRFVTYDDSKCVGFVLNGETNYTEALSHIVSMSGKKVLLIEAFPKKMQQKGLIHYLLGKSGAPNITAKGKFDILALGGHTDFVTELLAREKFSNFIRDCKENYDYIFIVTKENPKEPVARGLLDKVSKLMITLDEETLDDLYPYITWESLSSKRMLGFVSNKS